MDKAFDALKTYDWGQDRNLLKPIDDAVVATHGDKAARRGLELRLAAVLKTDASRDAKDFVCRKLMIIGTAESVPALAALLPDKELSHMARFALEPIPAPEAAQALRDALPKLDGSLKIGVIASLGARRDADSVPALAALAKQKGIDTSVWSAAIRALGAIGTVEAAQAIAERESGPNRESQEIAIDALLVCADRLSQSGNWKVASSIYNTFTCKYLPSPVRQAAYRGLTARKTRTYQEWINLIAGMLARNEDRDMQAVAFERVREGLKGAEATKQFAAQLPKLPPEVQVELLTALADRGDHAAMPAVLELLEKSQDPRARVAAVEALGALGEPADVPVLAGRLAAAAAAEKAAARTSLIDLRGQAVAEAIVTQWRKAAPEVRAELIGILVARRAADRVPDILAAATDPDARVRAAAIAALGELAGPQHVHDMLQAVLKAEPGPQREAAEKAVMFVCNRIAGGQDRAGPVLAAWAKLDEDQKTALLPLLGRLGSAKALEIVEAALAAQTPQRREAGLRALCNWPDSSVTAKLLDLARTDADADHRLLALRAAIRVAALPDKRSPAERLETLKECMKMAARNEERNLVLQRVRAVRTIESLRFVAAYLDRPEHAQEACATIVELAHHRELREPNKAEFDKALDAVIRTAKDPGVVDRAKRYKKGQT